ncbi:uncharacterized membrane protein YoaK (UPF0700 family) [Duganella sp. 1224]|uniref:YoaK family protein n=1 Tax=Duganella sp. 1224 TaxID=2587052 RepID=UPI0015C94B9C|nr:YoaK family protein [Duganella sp. 1224]NYE61602.1 uncharacterized membrane protein YoaK (UPF0700 family) [Duganella sp. 1224]
MPLHYLRSYAGPQRTDLSNRRLGRSLAFVAGAVNAGGFFAVGQYTSHMSGVVSALADNLALGHGALLLAGLASLAAFFAGAAVSAILINWGRRRAAHSRYALPLLLEAALLLAFGLLGARATAHGHLGATVALLCFVMGLQNAIITKASRAEIRTTHVTGLVTDIGIELGKLCYWNRDPAAAPVVADRGRLALLGSLLAMFLAGGVAGALGFQYLGYGATLPLAGALLVLALVPLLDDVRERR